MATTNVIKRKILRNSFWSLTSSILNRFGSLALTIILARFLMPEKYGLYIITLSIAMIFCSFSDLGISSTFVRYISMSIKKDKSKIPVYYRYLLKIKFFLTLALSLILIIISYPLAIYVFKNNSLFLPFLVAAFYIFALSFESFYQQVFYLVEKVYYLNFKEFFNSTLRIVFSIFIFYFIASSYQVVGIFVSFALVSLFMTIFSIYYAKKIFPELFVKSIEKIDKKKVIVFAGFMTFISISSLLLWYIDSILLGFFVSPLYAGYYQAAESLVLGVVGILSFPTVIFLPVFSKLSKNHLKKSFDVAIRYLSLITIPAIFGFLALGRFFIKLLYGANYLPSAIPLYFLSPLLLLISFFNLFSSIFTAKGKLKIYAKLIIITGIIDVVLNLVLINTFNHFFGPSSAMIGSALSLIIAWTFFTMGSLYYLKKELDFKISINYILKPLISGIIMFLILTYSITFITKMNWFFGIIEVLVGAAIYFIVLLLLKGLDKRDIDLVKISLKRDIKPL